MNIKQQLAADRKRAGELAKIGAGRDFTDAEHAEIETLMSTITHNNELIARMDAADAALKSVTDDADEDDDDSAGVAAARGDTFGLRRKRGFLPFGKDAAKLAEQMAGGMLKASGHASAGGSGRKALMPAGSTATQVNLQSQTPVELGRVAPSFLSLLPVIQNPSPTFQYIVQTTRTNNAAPVAVGATKPTTVLGLERKDGKLHVVAHLSEAIDKYLLEDNDALAQFVQDELLYNLYQALERQALNGDGTGENLHGILNTSGVQSQAFETDIITTARKAKTKLEAEGQTPAVFVLSAGDWETAELSRTIGGWLDLGLQPVQSATQMLWSVPVAVSQELDDGQGVLLAERAVGLNTDTKGVEIKWSENFGDDFSKNQLRARCEGRFEVATYRPRGVVVMDTAE